MLACEPMSTRTRDQRTVFDELLFIVDDADVISGQVDNLAVLHFPQLIGNLGDQSCRRCSSVKTSCKKCPDIRKS